MWRLMVMLSMLVSTAHAQKYWDGGAGTDQWNESANWSPDGVPGISDDVLLDNTLLAGSYTVQLPGGAQSTQVNSIRISPATGSISLVLPVSNTALPGLSLAASGESMVIDDRGVFVNASAAASGNPFQISGKMRINNGGKYVHKNVRGNAELIDKLVVDPGTEKGIFEFDVPGTAGYTVSLTGNTFGTLSFRASAAGGTKSYSGSGISNLIIRGDLLIETGAQVTSTLNADIELNGSLFVNGKLNLHPSTTGTTGRSFVFGGKDVVFQVVGTFSMNAFFRNLLVAKNASLTLETPCLLSLTPNTFICLGTLHCRSGYIGGPGSFLLGDEGRIKVGSTDGICLSGDKGDIRTAFRNFSIKAAYEFAGTVIQVSGDAIPDTVEELSINNPSGLRLSKAVAVNGLLNLNEGRIISDASFLLTLVNAAVRSPGNSWNEVDQGWGNSYVAGPVRLLTKDTNWRSIPIGSEQEFAPIRLKGPDMNDHNISLEYRTGAYPAAVLLPSLTRLTSKGYYLVTGATADPWKISMSYTPADTPTAEFEQMTIALLQEVNGEQKWGKALTVPIGTPYATVTTSGYGWLETDSTNTAFHAIALGYEANGLLPLELLEFSGINAGQYNVLEWQADQDHQPSTFNIERSTDGIGFTSIIEIRSEAGGIVKRQWKDMLPPDPRAYYRLIMKTENRRIVSRIIRIEYQKRKAILYPNPVSNWLSINFSEVRSDTYIEVVNRYGTVLRKLFVKKPVFQIRVSDLSPGLYFVRLRSQKETITLPFTKY